MYDHLGTVSRPVEAQGWGGTAAAQQDPQAQFEQNFAHPDPLIIAGRIIACAISSRC